MTNKQDELLPEDVRVEFEKFDRAKYGDLDVPPNYELMNLPLIGQQYKYKLVQHRFEYFLAAYRDIHSQRNTRPTPSDEVTRLQAEIDRCYKMNCGRDYMHLPLAEAVQARIADEVKRLEERMSELKKWPVKGSNAIHNKAIDECIKALQSALSHKEKAE